MRATCLKPLLVVGLVLMGSSQSRATWRKAKVSPSAGGASAIAVNSAGNPHILFQGITRSGDHVLAHAWLEGKRGHVEIVDTGDVGWDSAIAIDSNDHLHASYRTDTASLKYAYFDGQSWQATVVDQGGYSSSITVDSADRPHIAYTDGSGPASCSGSSPCGLRYAHFDGNGWITEPIPGGGLHFGQTSIALTASGVVHISSSDGSLPRRLYWTTNASGVWETEIIDDGRASSLDLDGSAHPRIAYFSEATLELKYASFDGLSWAIQTLDTGPIDAPSLELDANGSGRISYGSCQNCGGGGAESLRYARQDGAVWSIVTVDRSNSGQQTALALDPLGLPNIAYQHAAGRESSVLRYARLTLPDLAGTWRDLAASGSNLEATLDLVNRGNEASRAFTVAFYLSDDVSHDPADTPVGRAKRVAQLGVGKTRSLRFSTQVEGSSSGRYLIAVIDSAGKVEEAIESNNTAAAGIP